MEHIKMGGIFHLFLIFLFSMFFMWIGITYVSQNIQYSSAQRFLTSVVRELENNYFEEETVERCRKRAADRGYQLTVQVYGTREHRDAKVILDFSYTFPIIRKVQTYSMEGYAR